MTPVDRKRFTARMHPAVRFVFSAADEAEIKRRYLVEGHTTEDIGADYGCSRSTIANALKRLGVAAKPRRTRPRLTLDSRGYYRFCGERVHRIVAEAWYRPLRPGEHVHHVDGDTTNNHPENLRILSAEEHHFLHWRTTRAHRRRGSIAVAVSAADPD